MRCTWQLDGPSIVALNRALKHSLTTVYTWGSLSCRSHGTAIQGGQSRGAGSKAVQRARSYLSLGSHILCFDIIPKWVESCTQPQLSEHMAWYTRARNAQWAGLTMRAFNGAFGAFGTHHFWGGHSAVGVPSDVGNVPCVVLQIRFLHTPGHQGTRAPECQGVSLA